MKTDTKFFTNTDSDSLLDRFCDTLAHTKYFDVLVGYFRSSGFAALANSLNNIEKIRILVGLNTDISIYEALSRNFNTLTDIAVSHDEIRKSYSKMIEKEIENAPETQETEDSISKFLKFIKENKIEIRGHPSRNIHAKVYIMRYHTDQIAKGSVITGSSNFSFAGFTAQREFNVELKDPNDIEFALEKFEYLWNEGIDLTKEFIITVTNFTWFNNNISPYELYLKCLYEYFKEDINIDDYIPPMLPEGFSTLEYQRQAVVGAIKIINTHGGVFLSDVVGLGKTFISAMILQQLKGHKLIICPPVLKDYWEEVLQNFYVHPFKVVSSGKLDDVLESNHSRFKYVLVDESHKFRNELTQSYTQLKNICIGKKIILVSATPFNNKISDLLSQIKLFQSGKKSTIPGVSNIDSFFKRQERELKQFSPGTQDYKNAADKIAATIRDKILKYIMIRRTRGEVIRYFPEDLIKQDLCFPEVANPITLSYKFDSIIGEAFQQTINLLKSIRYARYTPLLYLKTGPTEQQKLSQNNARGFIKCILIKRLESSFFAFNKTINRFINSYKIFIEAYEKGKVYIGKGVDIEDLLDYDDIEELDDYLNSKGIDKYNAQDFHENLYNDLLNDKELLKKISETWNNINTDPKINQFIKSITTNPLLKDQRILVFTESKETAEYLFYNLEKFMPGQCMAFSSHQGLYKGKDRQTEIMSVREARRFIQQNFDPSSTKKYNDIRILITTDVLSEGMNLHIAGRIINYDLPWNPTRIMQRVGRINRVGTAHKTLYIFNFFPTEQADEHLGLEANILKKITEFNAVLGNDSKFLYLDENPDPHGLLGRLSVIKDEEDEGDSELQYLQLIRQIRDRNPSLFEKIKYLPIKARSAHDESKINDSLIVFFREGALKRFVQITKGHCQELTFLEAAPCIQCSPKAIRCSLPNDYYQRLQNAKEFLTSQDSNIIDRQISTRNTKLLDFIRALQRHSSMTDIDQEYLQLLYKAVQNAEISKKTIMSLQKICKKADSPISVINEFHKIISHEILNNIKNTDIQTITNNMPRQIVLTQYLV